MLTPNSRDEETPLKHFLNSYVGAWCFGIEPLDPPL